MQEDSDEIRRFIEARLEELGLDAAVVSVKIGKNRGYLYDYLRKRSPKRMPDETKVKLAKHLKAPPTKLGVVPWGGRFSATHGVVGGFADDAVPYQGPSFATFPSHLAPFTVKSRSLDQHPRRIVPGMVLVMNLTVVDPAEIELGKIVVAQLYDRDELTKCHGTVIRQFLPPDKLVTNSSETNEIIALDDPNLPYIAVIKGALEHIWIDVRENGNRQGDSHNLLS